MSNCIVIKIPNGTATSNDIPLYNYNSGVAIELPAALTGTALAIHGSIDGTNFKPIYNDNGALSITYTASTIHVISPVKLFGVERIRLVSTGNEGAERSFNVVAISPIS